jgi:hypothetical protein
MFVISVMKLLNEGNDCTMVSIYGQVVAQSFCGFQIDFRHTHNQSGIMRSDKMELLLTSIGMDGMIFD